MNIGVAKERTAGEQRVALGPDSIAKLIKAGGAVFVERGAGTAAGFPDAVFEKAGATLVESAAALYATSAIVLRVQPPTLDEAALLPEGSVLIASLPAATSGDLLKALAARKITAFALEKVPRITRAQSMDMLSSQSTVSGYKAVLLGAATLPKFLPSLTTAAGSIPPARVFVLGAGVAGLQAIATAKRLGAQVEGFDVRPETREQIQSLGAKFLDLGVSAAGEGGYARALTDAERAEQQRRLGDHLKTIDVVVCTAAVPGRPAPKILTAVMVAGMKPGSVIVDLAAETGGTCELTRPGETFASAGVTIAGPLDLASQGALHASEMYARNVLNFVGLLLKEGRIEFDWNDELLAKTVWPPRDDATDTGTSNTGASNTGASNAPQRAG